MDVVFMSSPVGRATAAADPATQPLHDAEVDLLVMGAGEDFASDLSGLDDKFGGQLVALLKARSFTGKAGSSVSLPTLGRLKARDLLILGLGARDGEAIVRAAGRAGRTARDMGARTVAIALGTADKADALAQIEAFEVGNYVYDKFKAESDRTPRAEKLLIAGSGDARAASVRAKWQSWVRDLVNAPAAEIYPATLGEAAKSLEKLPNVTVEIWDLARLQKEQCVGIIAVGQGSAHPPVLAHVRYRPKEARQHVALVGKGVTFDSGGLSLKPSNYMQTMRCDMGGAATVLGAIAIAAELGLPVAVDCIIGASENMNSGSSFKLGDVLTYRNGVTVEIHNTDAEGRLVLADCLINACKEPGVTQVVDVATLTGAIVVALGSDFTGLYTPEDDLGAALTAAAAKNAEYIWRMPLHEPYKQLLKGDWGQIKNITGKPDAGSGTAALFLQHFVEGVKWAHLDIAGSAFFDKGSGPYAAGATGQMVRTLADWIAAKA